MTFMLIIEVLQLRIGCKKKNKKKNKGECWARLSPTMIASYSTSLLGAQDYAWFPKI